MKDRIFFDTNVIYYAYDSTEPEKSKIASALLKKVFDGEILGVVSNQILGEVFNSTTRNLDVPTEKAKIIVRSIIVSDKWEKVDYNYKTVDRALINPDAGKIPFWDLIIAETMKENHVFDIFTENEKDFKGIEGIRTTNPFKK